MDVLLLSSQEGDWEGLYVNGEIVDQGHRIDRDDFLELAEKYNFKSSDVRKKELTNEDEEETSMSGRFPRLLSELAGNYSI